MTHAFLQPRQVALSHQDLLLINYALKELVKENKRYDDFASCLICEQGEELIERINEQHPIYIYDNSNTTLSGHTGAL